MVQRILRGVKCNFPNGMSGARNIIAEAQAPPIVTVTAIATP